jgi:hypothetical protein
MRPNRQACSFTLLISSLIFCALTNAEDCTSADCKNQEKLKPADSKTSEPTLQKEILQSKNISYVLSLDLTLKTFLKCQVGAHGINCGGDHLAIPTFHFLDVRKDFDQSVILKLSRHDNGCYPNDIKPEDLHVDRVSSKSASYKIRLYKSSDISGPPWLEFKTVFMGDRLPMTGTFPPFRKYYFRSVKVAGKNSTFQVVHKEKSIGVERDFEMGEGSGDFSSLFSLGATRDTLSTKRIKKGDPFIFKFQPAINVDLLVKSGVTEKSVNDYMTPHLGDFLILNMQDNYGKKYFCKVRDQVTGEIKVSNDILKNFKGRVSFALHRYKITRKQLSADADLSVVAHMGMYSDGTDAHGQITDSVSVWIED